MNKPLKDLQLLRTLEGVPAVNVLHLGAEVPDGNTVTINGRVYECDDTALSGVADGHVRVSAPTGFGSVSLTLNAANVVDGNTVTIAGKTYTFKSTLTNVDGYVKIGPTLARSAYNLCAAIGVSAPETRDPENYIFGDKNDIGEGAGVAYAAATTACPRRVFATYGGDLDLTLNDLVGGAGAAAVALAASLVGNAAWEEWDAPSPPSAGSFGAALTAALNSDAQGPVLAELVSASEVLVWSRRLGDVRLSCASAFTNGANAWEWTTLAGGAAARDGLMPVGAACRVATEEEAAQHRLHFVFGFEPSGALLQVRSDDGTAVAFDGPVVLSGRRVTATAGTVAITAGQVFNLMVFK